VRRPIKEPANCRSGTPEGPTRHDKAKAAATSAAAAAADAAATAERHDQVDPINIIDATTAVAGGGRDCSAVNTPAAFIVENHRR